MTKYKLEYNLEGGKGTLPKGGEYEPGAKVKLGSGSGITKEGFTFGGWGLEKGDDGVITSPFDMPEKDITVYAIWKKDKATPVAEPTKKTEGMFDTAEACQEELDRIISVCQKLIGAESEDTLEARVVYTESCDAYVRSKRSGKPVKVKYIGFDF